jgi:predicted 2-oxoglutarate/Fe(II)-dependent dioxygenase YbiX
VAPPVPVEIMKREALIYPIPLRVKSLPAAVKVPGFLTPDHCERLISLATRKGLQSIEQDRFGNPSTTASCRLLPEDDELIYELFARKATDLNAELWGLSLTGIYEPFSVLRYRTNDWIRPHIDADYRVPDPSKLTCSIQLVPGNAFTGGVLTIAESEHFHLEVGDAVIFPSHMLHTVSPIQSGERFALAAWVHGPAFK